MIVDSKEANEVRHRSGQRMWPLLVLFLLLATGLRFYELDAQSFWNDEGNSARLSERDLPLIVEGTASDVHPPLYYLLLRGWREFLGDSEFGLRSFSAFAGILTVAATIALSRAIRLPGQRRSNGKSVVFITAFITAVSPTLIYYSQETRMYMLLALLGSLSTWVLWRWLYAERRWSWSLAYISLTTAGLYTHYFYPTLIVFQGLIMLLLIFSKDASSPSRSALGSHWVRTLLTWCGMLGTSLLFYLPWAPIFLQQTGGRGTERAPLTSFLWDSLRWMTFGETIGEDALVWASVIVIIMLLWAVFNGRGKTVIPILGVLLPIMAMLAAGTTNPAFYKFMIVSVPFLFIWLAGAFYEPLRGEHFNLVARAIAVALSLPIIIGMAISLHNLYSDTSFARADYRDMAERIAAGGGANAAVILDAPNQWEVFTYYHQEGAPVYPLPKGQPDPQILEPQLAEIADRHDRIYALYWGEDQRDPQHIVENWLDKNTFKAAEEWVGDVRFVTYATAGDLDDDQIPQNINFDNKITLLSAAVAEEIFAPGDIVQVQLLWFAADQPDERYKVFLHLVNDNGEIVAQQDSEPVGGISPTTTWLPDDIVEDNQGILLPGELPSGTYHILLGLYALSDPEARLNILGQGEFRNHILLDTITVE